jgi:hypothetical protein
MVLFVTIVTKTTINGQNCLFIYRDYKFGTKN